ncbi:MAG: PAS-domain containing protein, partial [Rhodobacteraceae bacterium]|nr:PAS-domain containing protein [Paracoccaceae bacterium]
MTHPMQSLTAAGLDLIAQGLSIYDADLRLAICNAPFQRMFDLPNDLVVPGAGFAETIRYLAECGEYGEIDDLEAFVTERVEIARAFQPHYMERTRANGRTISVEGSPLPQGGWVTVYTDITPVKYQENLLRARASELSDQVIQHSETLSATNRKLSATVSALELARRDIAENEARMRLTNEMMPAHIAHADASETYTYSNKRLSIILQGRPSNIVGMRLEDALGSTVYARIKDALQQAYAGAPSVVEFTDGPSAKRVRASFTPDGVGGIYILSMDITEETQARVALQQTRRRELAAQLTSGLAHDFSNLLTIILGLQSKISRVENLPPDIKDLVQGIEAAANRGGSLLNGIANLTGRRGPRPSATNIAQLLEETATLATPALPPDIKLSVTCDITDGTFLLDAGQLQDALLNLIFNARDASGLTGHITISARDVVGTWLEFTVSDTGPGFSADALQHGCDPFFTTKGAEGTGLGLPMVYDMTKLAGGDLDLLNGAHGAVVRMRLPLRPTPSAKTGMVLLVED